MRQVICYFQLFIYEDPDVHLSFLHFCTVVTILFIAECMNNLLCNMLIIIVSANFLYETI